MLACADVPSASKKHELITYRRHKIIIKKKKKSAVISLATSTDFRIHPGSRRANEGHAKRKAEKKTLCAFKWRNLHIFLCDQSLGLREQGGSVAPRRQRDAQQTAASLHGGTSAHSASPTWLGRTTRADPDPDPIVIMSRESRCCSLEN